MSSTKKFGLFVALCTVLSGCSAAPADSEDAPTATNMAPASVVESPWNLTAQRNLGFYAGVQVLSLGAVPPVGPYYCRSLTFKVPQESTNLNLTFAQVQLSEPSAGVLGFGAQSESRNQGESYPDVYNPNHSFLDEPKKLSFTNPESGTWTVQAFTQGAAYNVLGNLTIELRGTGIEIPPPLEVETTGPGDMPCQG